MRFTAATAAAFALHAVAASAQVTPAQGYTPPDDTPSIRVGMTLFGNYTYQSAPTIVDTAGTSPNTSHPRSVAQIR